MASNVFDEHFKNRLLAFQRDHGLAQDGTLGPQDWAKLTAVVESKPEPTAAKSTHQPASSTPFVITAEEYPLLFKLVTLCVTEAGAVQFIRDELGVDLDEINASIEEVLA